jgi:hypothetical protein
VEELCEEASLDSEIESLYTRNEPALLQTTLSWVSELNQSIIEGVVMHFIITRWRLELEEEDQAIEVRHSQV